MKNNVFLSLGSNLGDKEKNLHSAINRLAGNISINILKISSTYESLPMYFSSRFNFYNIVVLIETELKPQDLLIFLKKIEKLLGRDSLHHESREIDIDILTYGLLNLDMHGLIIPHPGIKERKFVLEPWAELDGDFIVPGQNISISDLLIALDTEDMCKKIYFKPLEEIIDV